MFPRLKVDHLLAEELVNRIPEEYFISSATTFLDPAMSGGQFLKAVIVRLRKYGHSNNNITSRIFGFESNVMRVNIANKKCEGLGRLEAKNFLEEKMNKKFDVILGNPPYQNPGKSKGEKLWYRFIRQSEMLLNDNGIMAMVTPNSWLSGGTNLASGKWGVLKDVFCKNQLLFANVHNITSRFFSKIGIQISYWIMKKTEVSELTTIEMENGSIDVDLRTADVLSPIPNTLSLSVVNKVLNSEHTSFDVKYFQHSTKPGEVEEKTSAEGEFTYAHWIMGSNHTSNLSIKYTNFDKSPAIRFNKIMFPVQSRYWQPFLDLNAVGALSQGYALSIDDNTNDDGFKSVFYSKLYIYINKTLQIDKNGCMKTNIVRKLPKLDMSKVWTDEEIYTHFKLTQKEINYIEANVK